MVWFDGGVVVWFGVVWWWCGEVLWYGKVVGVMTVWFSVAMCDLVLRGLVL